MAPASIFSVVVSGVDESSSEADGTSGDSRRDPRIAAAGFCSCRVVASPAASDIGSALMPRRAGSTTMSSYEKNEESKPPKSLSLVSGSNVGVREAGEPIGSCGSCWTLVAFVDGARRSAKESIGDSVVAETTGRSGGSSRSLRRLPAVRRPVSSNEHRSVFSCLHHGKDDSGMHPLRSNHLSSWSNGDGH